MEAGPGMKIARPTTAAEIRQAFLDYFEEKGHTRVPSAPLVPHGDDTLLFVNAGMVPFKDAFLGLEKRPYVRAASSQKCMRVSGKHNDLEEVGPSPRHHTFFEMLGNFSFGDYFKREAIHYAWEALTTVFGLPGERLVATVFSDDDYAFGVWQNEIGLPAERILRMGEKTNFWSMGDTGPCGPTSELHYDWGAAACTCGQPDCSVALDNGCARWLEVWNLVFMQFNQDASGVRTLLPKPGVDTGMGLERLVSVIQGAAANYDTDLFRPLMRRVQELLGHDDAQMAAQIVSYRVIADHARAITFLIGDGVLPGNEGRNYILRLVLRRAARYGRLLGFSEPFLHQVSRTVIDQMGAAYPDLVDRADFILSTIKHEEERFLRTLDLGLALLEELIAEVKAQGQTVLPGDAAFRLWDTYGFPLDLTRDIATENGLSIDMVGYRAALEQQRQRARAAAQFGGGEGKDLSVYAAVLDNLPAGGVEHLYLLATETETAVAALIAGGARVSEAHAGQQVEIVLAQTPFYVESGGQVSDTGVIHSAAGVFPSWEIAINDTRRPVAGVIVHSGQVTRGTVTEGAAAVAAVDAARRWDIMRNHTATHLLHAQLRRVLGAHVHQAGSLVAPDRLRFDFTHPGMVSPQDLAAIEQSVNDWIYRNDPVSWRWMAYKDAVATGAMALFGEKYGDEVRVVEIGAPSAPASQSTSLPASPLSRELCGGNHVNNTAEIGVFHIGSEGSVGSGVRRIEAVTGRGAHALLQERLDLLHRTASALGVPETEVDHKVQALLEQVSGQQKELARLRQQLARQEFQSLLAQVVEVADGIPVLAQQVAAADANVMRQMTDWFRNQLGSCVVVLGAGIDDKPQLVAAVTDDLVQRGVHAGKLVQAIAKKLGGGGGGRPNLAQAGGVDLAGLPAALAEAPGLVAQQLAAL